MNNSIFSLIEPVETDERSIYSKTAASLPLFTDIYFDEVLRLDGGEPVRVSGQEALILWVKRALKTQRGRYIALCSNYGCEVENLIGHNYSRELTASEAERYIKEALLINPYILSVEITDTKLSESVLTAIINLSTVYGDEKELEINV